MTSQNALVTIGNYSRGPLAQLVEQRTFNPLVEGSNPSRPTNPKLNRMHYSYLTAGSSFQDFKSEGLFEALSGTTRGLEKECLRITPQGELALTPHPNTLGSNLTHNHITTDFSESLLEFITSPKQSISETLQELREIHQFTQSKIQEQNEALWPSSMPCHLPDDSVIPLANYGHSPYGMIKHIYRRGLSWRYGPRMQTIAGVHYNMSFSKDFWERYFQVIQKSKSKRLAKIPLQDFISDRYLALIRNVLRWRWLLPLWFGASPAIDESFLSSEQINSPPKHLKPTPWLTEHRTWISPYATTLRLSDLGYSNTRSHQSIPIAFDNLGTYLAGLRKAVTTPYLPFESIGVKVNGEYRQLSNCLLQIENEYYGIIRPKRLIPRGGRPLRALQTQGVQYLEVRVLDLDPFQATGICAETLQLLDVFLITCLCLESLPLSPQETQISTDNYQTMILEGRKPGITFHNAQNQTLTALELASPFLDDMAALAEHLSPEHQLAVNHAYQVLQNPATSLSGQVYEMMASQKLSYIHFVKQQMQEHQKTLVKPPLTADHLACWEKISTDSLEEFQTLETAHYPPFEDYLAKYLNLDLDFSSTKK